MKLNRKIKDNKKVCRAKDIGSYVQGRGHNQGRVQNRVSGKLHRKIEHNENVCCAQEFALKNRSE